MTTKRFADIDLSFVPHPATGDLMLKRDEQAIKNSIKNLIMTMHYERKFNSQIGSSVNSLLFDTPSYATVALISREVRNTIENFEPRAVIQDIQVGFDPDNHIMGLTIIFNIVNTSTPITLQFSLDRTR
jgi:phage baseplate assembly protein W